MKSVVLFVCAYVSVAYGIDQALINEQMAQLVEYGLECAESENATPEDVAELQKHKSPVTHQGRCVIFCVYKKLAVMNEDGSIAEEPTNPMLETLKSKEPELYSKMESIHKTCLGTIQSNGDACDTAFELISCAKREGEKIGLDKLFSA